MTPELLAMLTPQEIALWSACEAGVAGPFVSPDALPAALTTIATLRRAIQRVREETDWCPVCDCHHSEPTEKCP